MADPTASRPCPLFPPGQVALTSVIALNFLTLLNSPFSLGHLTLWVMYRPLQSEVL